MKKYISILILFFLVIGFHACYYDKADLLYPSTVNMVCDTSAVISYAGKIIPLFQQQCYGCHTGTAPSGNILMGTYAADKAIASNGKLFGSISHTAGYSAMPKGGNKFTSCQIALVQKWINEGLPNN
ncbi:MAG: hypothetical protein RLZZ28_2431 [Bacteroidota bacterium]|jgi:hypothetical protein